MKVAVGRGNGGSHTVRGGFGAGEDDSVKTMPAPVTSETTTEATKKIKPPPDRDAVR